jgi:ABC-type Fe3+-hydroxamate transport system substrate-binding protein
MKVTTIDMMGRTVEVPEHPKRIVSLVPSQTELLIDLGAPVIGRTKFCIHPKEASESIPIIGGTKNFHFDKIRHLQPDLIIGNKEENYAEGIALLEKEFPVWMSDIVTLPDAVTMIASIIGLVGQKQKGDLLLDEISSGLDSIKGKFSGKVLYLIWKNPWMAAGHGTFVHHLLEHLGFENAVTNERYPELPVEDIRSMQADYIFLSSEPFPFKEKHLKELRSFQPAANVLLVDGEMFSWYGSRLRKASNYFLEFRAGHF